jgi:hypothetical protein
MKSKAMGLPEYNLNILPKGTVEEIHRRLQFNGFVNHLQGTH